MTTDRVGLYGRKDRVAASPEAYVEALASPRREDIGQLHARIRKLAPTMAASAEQGMLTYGRFSYRYKSGRTGEWWVLGVASNKAYISLYAPTLSLEPYVARLPRANLGRGCIRFKRVADVDREVIDEVIRASAANDGKHVTF
jgi:hypothetical protein